MPLLCMCNNLCSFPLAFTVCMCVLNSLRFLQCACCVVCFLCALLSFSQKCRPTDLDFLGSHNAVVKGKLKQRSNEVLCADCNLHETQREREREREKQTQISSSQNITFVFNFSVTLSLPSPHRFPQSTPTPIHHLSQAL